MAPRTEQNPFDYTPVKMTKGSAERDFPRGYVALKTELGWAEKSARAKKED